MALILYKPPLFAATPKGFPIHDIESYLCIDFILESIRIKIQLDDMFRVWAWRIVCIMRVLVCISKVLGLHHGSLVHADGEIGL